MFTLGEWCLEHDHTKGRDEHEATRGRAGTDGHGCRRLPRRRGGRRGEAGPEEPERSTGGYFATARPGWYNGRTQIGQMVTIADSRARWANQNARRVCRAC